MILTFSFKSSDSLHKFSIFGRKSIFNFYDQFKIAFHIDPFTHFRYFELLKNFIFFCADSIFF